MSFLKKINKSGTFILIAIELFVFICIRSSMLFNIMTEDVYGYEMLFGFTDILPIIILGFIKSINNDLEKPSKITDLATRKKII